MISTLKLTSLLVFLIGLTEKALAAHSRRRVVVLRPAEPRYDRSITTFDPTGRLLQVEYGMEAARRGESVAAALTDDGSIMVLTASSSQKVHRIDDHLWLVTAGLSGDARLLASHLRTRSRQHRLSYGEAMTVKEMAEETASVQHELTRKGGARPLGCTAIVLGMDPSYASIGRARMFRTDPGGMLEDCLFGCAGKNQERVVSTLEKNYDGIRSGTLSNSIRSFLDSYLESADDEEESHELWVFSPREGHRGKTKATCFLGLKGAENLEEISRHFKET